MKKKQETFFWFLLFIIMRIINESESIVEESLMAPWNKGLIDFENYFKLNFRFSYSSNESQVIHKQIPSNVGKGRNNGNSKSVIITKLLRTQDSILVIFLMADFWDFAPTFCHTQKITNITTLVWEPLPYS